MVHNNLLYKRHSFHSMKVEINFFSEIYHAIAYLDVTI